MNTNATINPKIPGKLIFAFKKIRKVSLIELRNGFAKMPDPSLLFHTRILGNKIYSNEVQWKRWERTQKLANEYAYFEILFSLDDESVILNQLNSKYDYILITSASDLVTDFNQACIDFGHHSKFSAFCKIRDVEEILKVYKNYFKLEENGSLAA